MGGDGYCSGDFGFSSRGDGWVVFVEIGCGVEGALSCAAWGVYCLVSWSGDLYGDLA
jgi:hypothetical protein